MTNSLADKPLYHSKKLCIFLVFITLLNGLMYLGALKTDFYIPEKVEHIFSAIWIGFAASILLVFLILSAFPHSISGRLMGQSSLGLFGWIVIFFLLLWVSLYILFYYFGSRPCIDGESVEYSCGLVNTYQTTEPKQLKAEYALSIIAIILTVIAGVVIVAIKDYKVGIERRVEQFENTYKNFEKAYDKQVLLLKIKSKLLAQSQTVGVLSNSMHFGLANIQIANENTGRIKDFLELLTDLVSLPRWSEDHLLIPLEQLENLHSYIVDIEYFSREILYPTDKNQANDLKIQFSGMSKFFRLIESLIEYLDLLEQKLQEQAKEEGLKSKVSNREDLEKTLNLACIARDRFRILLSEDRLGF